MRSVWQHVLAYGVVLPVRGWSMTKRSHFLSLSMEFDVGVGGQRTVHAVVHVCFAVLCCARTCMEGLTVRLLFVLSAGEVYSCNAERQVPQLV